MNCLKNVHMIFILLSMLVIAACARTVPEQSDLNNHERADKDVNQPVTLLIETATPENQFEDQIGQWVKKKYPYITLKILPRNEHTIQERITAGQIPDISIVAAPILNDYRLLGLVSDLNPMMKKYNIDASKFVPEVIDDLHHFGKNGELFGMPLAMNMGVLVYNKDIFNRFAVPYPKDGMTWNEILDLGMKLSRTDGDQAYIGIVSPGSDKLVRQAALPLINDQKKALLDSDGFMKVFALIKKLNMIPTIQAGKIFGWNDFWKGQIAMFPNWFNGLNYQTIGLNQKGGFPFDWDIVSFPVYENQPKLGREVDFSMAVVSPKSKHIEEAYRVLQVAVSEEAQAHLSKSGILSVMNNKYNELLGSDNTSFYGKNVKGIFTVRPATPAPETIYDSKIYSIINGAADNMVKENLDVNTVLRSANELVEYTIKQIDAK